VRAYVQVDQEALKAKARAAIAPIVVGKENGVASPLGAKSKTPFGPARSASGALGSRAVLGATTNQLAGVSLGSPKASADVDMDKEAQMAAMVCSLENKDACLMCGS
jgi:hypothetical protein